MKKIKRRRKTKISRSLRGYSKDHLGSTRSLTNENGTVMATVDYDAYGGISRAPVPANDASGVGPILTSAASRLTHSFAGSFDVNLPLSGAPGIEMRRAGATGAYQLVLTFDRNVLSDTSTTVAAGVGSVSSTTFSGNTATVQLSGVADRQTITVELDNVVGAVGVNSKVLVSMSICIGDVNQSGAVTVEDIRAVQSQSGHAVTTSSFQYDVNADGFIDAIDTSLDKSVAGDSLYPDFAFTGHYYHARSGLYLAPYRAYNPTIGRWLSRDPLRGVEQSQGPNLYSYVLNNPANLLDPLGLRYHDCCETQQILSAAYADATAGVIRGLLNIAFNSTGESDYKINALNDTFCVKGRGRPLSAPEFGNYIAGFRGSAYDRQYTPMAGGFVAAAGLVFHYGEAWAWVFNKAGLANMPDAEFDPLDFTGLPLIYAGYADALTFNPRTSSGCSCN